MAFDDVSVDNSGRLTVMKLAGTDWIIVGSPKFSQGEARFASLVFDSNDVPYVGFVDDGSLHFTTVMKLDGGQWTPVGSPGFSPGQAPSTTLAIDRQGVPYIAFRNAGFPFGASLMRFTANTWTSVGSFGFPSSVPFISMDLNSHGQPVVAFQDSSSQGRATAVSFDGTR